MMITLLTQVDDSFVIADYRKPVYYKPYKLLIGPMGEVIPGGTVWFYGGAFFGNWREYGIGQGVFTLGLANLMEVKLSLERLLSSLGGISGGAMAMKLKFLDLGFLKSALELKINPTLTESFEDSIPIYGGDGVYFTKFTRTFKTRAVHAFLPISLHMGKYTIAMGAFATQYGITIGADLDLDTSNCYSGVYCDSLKAYLVSDAFRGSESEETLNFMGGYLGLAYSWRENTDLIAEFNLMPRLIYRTMPKNSGYTLKDRYDENTYELTLFTFLGMRYSLLRVLSAEAGIVIPFGPSSDQGLLLLNSILYANVNLIVPLSRSW